MDYKENSRQQSATDFSVKDFIALCVSKWKWFLMWLVIFIGLGVLYIIRQQPVYERQEQVLIKDQDSGGGIGSLPNAFSSMGLLSTNTNVYNELIAITSPAVMYEVVERLGIDINYTRKKLPHGITLYGSNLPLNVKFEDIDAEGAAAFRIDLNRDGSARLYKFVRYTADGKEKYDSEVNVKKWGGKLKTPLGIISLTPNPAYTDDIFRNDDTVTIVVGKSAMQDALEHYGEKLEADLTDEDAEVIDISIRDVSVERAVDILNTVLTVYNENWVADKNKVALATSEFITERLNVIQQELGDVDVNIAKYQVSTGTVHLEESAKISLKKESEQQLKIVELENQLAISEFMRNYVTDPKNRFNIIPANMGVGSMEVEAQINAFNELLLTRNNLVANSSENNPLVENFDAQLTDMHNAIVKGINTQIKSLQTGLASTRLVQAREEGKIENTPTRILPLLAEGRQQKVKEALYLFLLEKREENELSQKFTADNNRVLTPPMGSLRPVAPRKAFILIIMVMLGIGIPLLYYYLKEVGNTKVRGKRDLETVRMPFAGEIPHVGKRGRLRVDGRGKLIGRKKDVAPLAVVEEGKRDVVNEAFRVIRSNLDFMSGKDGGCKVVMLTSFNPGSGKSFISYNLGLSFAIKGKKVLLVDCDLRHGSSSMFVGMPKKGLSDYLTGNADDWKALVKPSPANAGLDILPIGKMPPNPAELLENGRLPELIEEAKADYDYILLDCPPVNIVVDTQIVAQYADRTLFVVRAGLLERSALKELNEFYDEKKFRNMSLILNGTEAVHSRYYTYGNYQNL